MRHVRKLLRDESGQDLAEYALLIALIAIVVLASVAVLGGQIAGVFSATGSALERGTT